MSGRTGGLFDLDHTAPGKKCGLAYGSVPDRAAQAVRDGCDFAEPSNDASMLAEAPRDLAGAFRAQLSQ